MRSIVGSSEHIGDDGLEAAGQPPFQNADVGGVAEACRGNASATDSGRLETLSGPICPRKSGGQMGAMA